MERRRAAGRQDGEPRHVPCRYCDADQVLDPMRLKGRAWHHCAKCEMWYPVRWDDVIALQRGGLPEARCVEQLRRAAERLPVGAPALNREQALELYDQLVEAIARAQGRHSDLVEDVVGDSGH